MRNQWVFPLLLYQMKRVGYHHHLYTIFNAGFPRWFTMTTDMNEACQVPQVTWIFPYKSRAFLRQETVEYRSESEDMPRKRLTQHFYSIIDQGRCRRYGDIPLSYNL